MTTTVSDEMHGREAGPHSAVPNIPGETLEATNAGGRAGAREDSGKTAQLPPHSAVAPRDRFYDLLAWVQAMFTPPDIWSKERPSLRQIWEYADRGEWTTADGVIRNGGRVWALTVAPLGAAIGYSFQWVLERFTRLAGASVLLFLLFHIPPLSWLL